MEKFFTDDPEITWKKILCPVCGKPTGEKSDCWNVPKSEQKKISLNGQIPLGLYSQSCPFRQDNVWEISTNYPISQPLVEILAEVEGVELIVPTKKYTAQIKIAKAFLEQKVKRKVSESYNTFIKKMQSMELDLYDQIKKIKGIKLPNNEIAISEDSSLLKEINASIEDSEIISE